MMLKNHFYISIFITLFMISSCQKGDESINPHQEISSLTIQDISAWDLLYNGEEATHNSVAFKVLVGKGKLALRNKDTRKIDFEGEFDIKSKDTLYVFNPSPDLPVSLIRNNQTSEPKKDGYIKLKIIDYSGLSSESNPINLQFRASIDFNWDTFEPVNSEHLDTLFNVIPKFQESYWELPIRLEEIVPENMAPGNYTIEFLDKNNLPLLKDGKPIKSSFGADLIWTSTLDKKYDGTTIFTCFIGQLEDYGDYWNASIVKVFAN